jgi:hypothetical protein
MAMTEDTLEVPDARLPDARLPDARMPDARMPDARMDDKIGRGRRLGHQRRVQGASGGSHE